MVKRQKEKQYLSAREQKAQGRSRSNQSSTDPSQSGVVQKSLPFQCCALTLVPFENPVCTIYDDDDVDDGKTKSGSNGNSATKKAARYRYGIVFDNSSLTEFVWKHKRDPVTGKPLSSAKIIALTMDKDSETGQWQCPVLTKAFGPTTKIVAILSPSGGTSANVYSFEAYHELNVKPKSYVDLTTGLKFHPRTDVLILNDPENGVFQKTVRDVSNFWHIKNARNQKGNNDHTNNDKNIRKSVTATRVLEQIRKEKEERERKAAKQAEAAAKQAAAEAETTVSPNGFSFEVPGSNLPFAIPTEDVTGVKYSSGSAALGFTSTASASSSSGATTTASGTTSRAATAEEILLSRFNLMTSGAWKGKKGYVNLLVTVKRSNHRPTLTLPLLLELHCDIVPRTCANFLGLCSQHKYDGTLFHRLIEGFMIQGGGEKGRQTKTNSKGNVKGNTKGNSISISNSNQSKPTDSCLWGPDGFADEFDDRLKHTSGGGVLAMANAGPNTNKQQFYITLDKACPHLDRKHSVFGTVAKGFEAFSKALLEDVVTDARDKPVLDELDLTNGETIVNHAVVVIAATEVLEDPSREARELEEKRLSELHQQREAAAATKIRKRKAPGQSTKSTTHNFGASPAATLGIGKYLSAKNSAPKATNTDETVGPPNDLVGTAGSLSLPAIGLSEIGAVAKAEKKKKKKKKQKQRRGKKSAYGDFSSW